MLLLAAIVGVVWPITVALTGLGLAIHMLSTLITANRKDRSGS